MSKNYIKPKRLWLKTHSEFNEKLVQDRVAEDPALLNLGDLVLRDRECVHPRAGRLDLLLQDPDTQRRYEVRSNLFSPRVSHNKASRSLPHTELQYTMVVRLHAHRVLHPCERSSDATRYNGSPAQIWTVGQIDDLWSTRR